MAIWIRTKHGVRRIGLNTLTYPFRYALAWWRTRP